MARLSIDKDFRGDIEGVSRGEMISAGSGAESSGGYVAMERVDGLLHGRHGTFVLQHSSTMRRGTPTQSITVVPDSATGELEGLTGSMVIIIEDKKHLYEFDYTISPEP
jgi:hypothetical protein